MVVFFDHTVRCQVPIHRLPSVKSCFNRRCASPGAYCPSLMARNCQRFFYAPIPMCACKAFASVVLSPSSKIDLLFCAVTDISFVSTYQFLGQVVKSVKVIAAIGDLVGSEAEPPDYFLNRCKEPSLLLEGISTTVGAQLCPIRLGYPQLHYTSSAEYSCFQPISVGSTIVS